MLLAVVSLAPAAACSSKSNEGRARADCARLVPDATLQTIASAWRREQWNGGTCVLGPHVTSDETGERFVNVWLYCDDASPSVEHLTGDALPGLGRSAKRDSSSPARPAVYFVASRARCRVEVIGRGVETRQVEAVARSIDANLGPEAELPRSR